MMFFYNTHNQNISRVSRLQIKMQIILSPIIARGSFRGGYRVRTFALGLRFRCLGESTFATFFDALN